jgi:peptidoglycan-N-acetylglucosamine deacetylase
MKLFCLVLFFVGGSLFGNNLIVKDVPTLPFTIDLVPTNKKMVAITFDDGPNKEHTKEILQILKRNKAQATFFLISSQSEKNPMLIKEIQKNGHEIGNHSHSHIAYPLLSKKERLLDIAKSQKVFKAQLGYFPRYFRAPYGKMNKESRLAIKRFYKHHISWTIDPKDWEGKKESVSDYISQNIQSGAIILLHETSTDILNVLPKLMTELSSQGFQMVTITRLLEEYNTF